MSGVFLWLKIFGAWCILRIKVEKMSDLFEKLLILRSPGVGPVGYEKLIRQFGSVAAVAAGLRQNTELVDSVMREMDLAQSLGVQFISDDSEYYPVGLKNVKAHPPVISARGNLETLMRPCVGIVGTRHATATGMRFVADLADGFASHGVAVASGMAIGTDTAAHRGALRANGNMQTIAVLGGGVDYIWPAENESLYWEIVERGVIISEMPVGFIPKGSNFVQRNRWIAGIAQKLILSEADLKSGSMRTVDFAIEMGRDLWAVPSHPLDARAAGPNSLIKTGVAHLCSGVGDFFNDTKKSPENRQSQTENSDLEDLLLDALGSIPVSESVLAQVVKKSISEIKRGLVILELRGSIKKTDMGYVRI